MTGDEALGMSGPSLAEHSLPAGDDLIGVTEVDLFGGQHRDAAMAFESASGGRILTPGRRASVLIGECTSDNGVHVHRNAIFMCAPALPYVAACLTVAARPPERRRRSGAFGRRRERPPGFDASIGIAEGWHVHTHATLRRGSLPSSNP